MNTAPTNPVIPNPTTPNPAIAPWKRRRRGAVALLVAVCLIAILAIVAIVLDGGALMEQRREAQAVADAAALAGATDLFMNYPTQHGVDVQGTAAASAYAVAAQNGYANDNVNTVVTVNIPPTSGDHAGMAGYVEVIAQCNEVRFFSKIWGTSRTPISARAVARGTWAAPLPAIIVLEPLQRAALNSNGNGIVSVTRPDGAPASAGSIIVDSSNWDAAANASGTNARLVTAGGFYITGGYRGTQGDIGSGAQFQGPIFTDVPPTADPFFDLPTPQGITLGTSGNGYMWITKTVDATGAIVSSSVDGGTAMPASVNGVVPDPSNLGAFVPSPTDPNTSVKFEQATIYNPGTYSGNALKFSGGSAAFFMPGIYIIGGNTGFSVTGSGDVGGNGVMMYTSDPGGSFSIAGGGFAIFTPPTSGTYQGMTFFQNRLSTATSQIVGNGLFNIAGAVYAAGTQVKVSGNGATSDVSLGSLFVSKTLEVGGNGNFNIAWNPNTMPPVRRLQLVE
jgi:hypothetical protein